MRRLRTTTIRMTWCEHQTVAGRDVLRIGGESPGGEQIKVHIELTDIPSIAYLADKLDDALKHRERQIADASQRIKSQP